MTRYVTSKDGQKISIDSAMSLVIDVLRELGRDILEQRELERRKFEADRRRAALTSAGCATYLIDDHGGKPAIICLCCGLGTLLSLDVETKWCSFCLRQHQEWGAPDESFAQESP